jgi:hypothetical protein
MSVLVELIAALRADLAAASKRIAYLDSQLEAKDRLNAELVARIQGRRTRPIIPDPYIAAKTAPRGEM